MNDTGVIYFFIALAAATIGAVPLGLVNLSVVDTALKNGSQKATGIAHGASVVEVIFALSSLVAGAWLSEFFKGNPMVRYFVFAVLMGSGLFFWLKKNKGQLKKEQGKSIGFLKGALLNIVSIPVLLFWLLAATVLSAKQLLPSSLPEILFFLSGVWLAKMVILKIYVFLALKVVSRAHKLSSNINRVIGIVLMTVAVIQLLKI
ncbi:MAG: LysE family transporter [Prolixibacteraceae bacterium]|nr:LysE family transporter [Prolixibacteraceae bacterium]